MFPPCETFKMADIRVKFVSQKISKLRWRPSVPQASIQPSEFASGNWDDKDSRVCLWQIPASDQNYEMDELESGSETEPRVLCELPHNGDVTGLQFLTADHVVASSSTGTVTLYKHHRNSQTLGVSIQWERLHYEPGERGVPSTCVATQGDDLIVSVGEDGRLNVLNVSRRKPVRTIDKADSTTLNAVTFLKQLEMITVNSSGQLKVFDLRQTTDDPARTFSLSGEQMPLHCVCRHPTQQHIVATGGHDGVLSIWDLRQDKYPVTLLEAHSGPMWEVMFHPHQPDHLFTCSEDGSVWHWDSSAVSSLITGTGAGVGGGSVFSQQPVAGAGLGSNSSWLSLDAGRSKMEITTLLPHQSLPINTLDIESNTLICGTDEEAIFTVDIPGIR